MPSSRNRYTLDLDDVIVFPDIGHVPVLPPKEGESWYIITEVCNGHAIEWYSSGKQRTLTEHTFLDC